MTDIHPHHPHHHHISFLLIITILLIIGLLVLIKPALLGYKINKQFEEIEIKPSELLKSIDAIKSKLLIAETNLDSCKSLNKEFAASISEEKNNSLKCLREKDLLEIRDEMKIQELEFNLTKLSSNVEQQKMAVEQELEQEKIKNTGLQNSYDLLSENSANNICCKTRVDNKDIDSYIVSNNVITCTIGEKNKINC